MICCVQGCESNVSGTIPVCSGCWLSVPDALVTRAYEAYVTGVGRPWAAERVLAWLEGREPLRPHEVTTVAEGVLG